MPDLRVRVAASLEFREPESDAAIVAVRSPLTPASRGETMLKRMTGLRARLTISAVAVAASVGIFPLAGCERKERVVDVQTPIGDVKVDKTVQPDGDTSGVEVNTNTR
jgi:hypothetical protein